MRGWRWMVVAVVAWSLIVAAGTNTVVDGLLFAYLCAAFWALRVHVILEPGVPHVTDADLWALIERG